MESRVTKHVLKVRMERTVPISVNVTTVLNVLRNLECVYVQPDGEDSNVICPVRNHISVKTVKMNVNVKMMRRVVQSMVNIEYMKYVFFFVYILHLPTIFLLTIESVYR